MRVPALSVYIDGKVSLTNIVSLINFVRFTNLLGLTNFAWLCNQSRESILSPHGRQFIIHIHRMHFSSLGCFTTL